MKRTLIIILLVVLIVGAIVNIYILLNNKKNSEKANDPTSGSSMLPVTDPKEKDVSASFKSIFTNPQAQKEIKAAGSKIQMTGIKLPGLN